MLILTARQWLDEGRWGHGASSDAHRALTERVGADKADEFVATMDRVATNLLYTLDNMKMSEGTMAKFITFATAVALDNALPHERGT